MRGERSEPAPACFMPHPAKELLCITNVLLLFYNNTLIGVDLLSALLPSVYCAGAFMTNTELLTEKDWAVLRELLVYVARDNLVDEVGGRRMCAVCHMYITDGHTRDCLVTFASYLLERYYRDFKPATQADSADAYH